jgi:hypothetical protein
MSETPKIHSFNELQERIRSKKAEYLKSADTLSGEEREHSMGAGASGDKAEDISDASNKGTQSTPSDPSVSNDNSTLPGNKSDNNPDGDGNANGNIGKGNSKDVVEDASDKGHKSNPDDPSESNDNSTLPADGSQQETSSRSNTKISTADQGMSLLQKIQKRASGFNIGTPGVEIAEKIKKQKAEKTGGDSTPNAAENSDSSKTAGSDQLHQVDGFAAKLASSRDNLAALGASLLQFEEGVEFAERILRKSAGAEMAQQIIKNAAAGKQILDQHASDQAQLENWFKSASAEEKAQVAHAFQVNEIMKSASEEDKHVMEKLAKIHNANVAKLSTEAEKRAYDQGAMDAALMMDMAEGEEGMPAEGAAPEPSIEEILMILEQLVASGQIAPEEAEQIMQLLAAEGGAEDPAAAEEAAMAEAMAAEGGAPAEEGMVAMASVQQKIASATASLKK